MASASQIQSRSIFDRDGRRGTIGEDTQNALVDSDETQPPSQPLDHAMITHGSSDAMGNPGAREVLSPESLWFDDNKVSRQVTQSIKSYYRTPYTCWRETPDHIKAFWWNAFKDRYRWTTEHASLVKEAYWQKGRNRLKDMVCKVSKKKPTDVIPWLSPDVHRQLLHHKRTNNGFLRRSTQSRLNKITGPKAGTRHTQGSVSAAAIAKKMRKDGEIVTAAKLYSKTHTKPKDKTFTDDRSKATWEKYQALKVAKQVPPSQEDDSLFLEAVGGWSEKGTVYGLGNSVGLFYEKPTNNATPNKPSYTPSIVAQLQTELVSTKTELNSTKYEIQQQHTSMEEQQRKMVQQQRQIQEQQRQIEEQKKRMEEQKRMTEAQCKMMEDQKQALLGMQSQMALMSSLLGHPSELHDSEK